MLHWTVHVKGPKRHYSAAVAVGLQVFTFGDDRYGGEEEEEEGFRLAGRRSRDYIHVHVFNTVSWRWRKLSPWTGRRAHRPPEVPSMRHCHTAVLMEGAVYVWGGYNCTGSSELCNVLYAFHVDTRSWSKPPGVHGSVPEPRYNHSACVRGKVMYVFGGEYWPTGCTNAIYKLDTADAVMLWSLINTRGTAARVSSCHSATVIGTKMFVFGGRGDRVKDHYNNIRVFEMQAERWLSVAPSAQFLPERRDGHSAFAHAGELYVFGGGNLNRTFSDLWKFSPESFSWTKVEPRGGGPGSWTSSMCCCVVGERVVLFGGYGFTPGNLYVLDLSPNLKTLCKLAVLQHGLEQSELPHDIRWELDCAQSPHPPGSKAQDCA